MTTSKPIRVALYCRISTTGHGQDVGLQLDELRSVAAQRGWVIQGEYIDEGVSGSKDSRPALDLMMGAARTGKLDLVAVWRFDRFARSTQHLLQALEEFRVQGVQFISLRENIETGTPVGRMIFTMVAAIAEFEKSLIVERVKAGVARAQAAGTHCGRPRRELDLRAAQILIDQGHSVRQVSEMLDVPRGTLRRRLAEADRGGSKVPQSLAPETTA
ncbi:MAG: recombinase family protein [Pseudomonadota bacterium]